MWFKAFGYISYVIELLTLASSFKVTPNDVLAARIADIVYRAVDYGTSGLASRSIDRQKLTEAVRQVVDVVDDVL